KATPKGSLIELAAGRIPDVVTEFIGSYIDDAALLGRRTAEMHLALGSRTDVPAFAPEPFTPHYQRSIYQSFRTQAAQTLQLLRRRARGRADAEALLARESELQQRPRRGPDKQLSATPVRTHGDLHLGHVLRP